MPKPEWLRIHANKRVSMVWAVQELTWTWRVAAPLIGQEPEPERFNGSLLEALEKADALAGCQDHDACRPWGALEPPPGPVD